MNDVIKRLALNLPVTLPGYVIVTKKPQIPKGDAKMSKGNGKE